MDKLTSKQMIAAIVTFQGKTGADLDEILKFVKEITTITTQYGISLMKEKIKSITVNPESGELQ